MGIAAEKTVQAPDLFAAAVYSFNNAGEAAFPCAAEG